MHFRISRSGNNAPKMDESAPRHPGRFILSRVPSYSRKGDEVNTMTNLIWVSLTISDILATIRKEAHLARQVLFESARLKRHFYSVGPVKLPQNALAVDKNLVQLSGVLWQGDTIIQERWERNPDEGVSGYSLSQDQSRVLEGEAFKKALRTAKKSLLELEKAFNDQILGQLKNGMERKGIVDHGGVVKKVKHTRNELCTIYDKLKIVHNEEMEALEDAQAHNHEVNDN